MAIRSISCLAAPPNRESARRTASCPPCPPPANGSGGWWSSEPASRITAMRSVLLLWAASVCDGACPTLEDAAGLPPPEVSASPPPRLAAISSAVGTHCRASPKPWPTPSWNNPTHNPWVGKKASTTAWLSTPTTSCARQSCLGCAQQHSIEQREQLFMVDVSG